MTSTSHPKTIPFANLPGSIDQVIPPSGWITIDQDMVDRFADLTNDHNWIHVDVDRANREIGGTIAHGLLVLALMPTLLEQTLLIEGVARSLNYGYDRVRFTAPTPVGCRIRLSVSIKAVAPQTEGCRVTYGISVEREGAGKPVLVCDWIVLLIGA